MPVSTRHADVAVVGLGLIGSAALRELAADEVSCIGVGPGEPFDLAHHTGPFASHYDSGRVTRHLDPVREWAILAARSIAGYGALEAESGFAFHRPVGAVLAEFDGPRIDAIRAVADELGVAFTETAPIDNGTFDTRLAFPPGSTLLAEGPPAGHIDPRRMLRANLVAAVGRGASLLSEPASVLESTDSGWKVTTPAGETVAADRLLVATGAHSDELAGLVDCPPFAVRGETIVMATLDDSEQQRLSAMPSVLSRLNDSVYADLYVVPPTPYPDGSVRLKLGATLRDARRLYDGEARRRWMSGDEHTGELAALRDLLEALVPGLRAEHWETKPCLITDTGSGLPVVDHVAPGVVLAAGGNGFAAKSANAIGALAARLVTEGRWTDEQLDASRFTGDRRRRSSAAPDDEG